MSQALSRLLRSLLAGSAALCLALSAQAAVIFDTTLSLSAGDATQQGRLSRSGVTSDWSAPKAFPGVFGVANAYRYQSIFLDMDVLQASYVTPGQYFQFSIDSVSANTFVSVYLNSYDPTNLALNYLGDAGSSGNPFPGTPRFFSVFAPLGSDLVLVFNETGVNAGLGQPANILVEAFLDTDYTDLELKYVPEPASMALVLGALVAAGASRRTRKPEAETV